MSLGLSLVLASASPRRASLLRDAGVRLEVTPVPCDESAHRGEEALAYAGRIAALKLRTALDRNGRGQQTLAADTVVWLDDDPTPIGKPADGQACAQTLARLSTARGHRVTTAWALGRTPQDIELHTCTTSVWMRPLAPAELEAYLQTDAWRDKAGGYGIQAEAASWVTRIEGSYTNVVGLPVAQVIARLQERRE